MLDEKKYILYVVYAVHKKFNMSFVPFMSFDKSECEKLIKEEGDTCGYSWGITEIEGKYPFLLKIIRDDHKHRFDQLKEVHNRWKKEKVKNDKDFDPNNVWIKSYYDCI